MLYHRGEDGTRMMLIKYLCYDKAFVLNRYILAPNTFVRVTILDYFILFLFS